VVLYDRWECNHDLQFNINCFLDWRAILSSTGLSLAITHNIMAAHCGEAQEGSKEGKGGTFLPLPMRSDLINEIRAFWTHQVLHHALPGLGHVTPLIWAP
jgi:hypothetical protein